jgi:hypothetical protein
MLTSYPAPASEHFLFDENLSSYPSEFRAWTDKNSKAFLEVINDVKMTRSRTGSFIRTLSSTTGVHVDIFSKFVDALVVCACGNLFTYIGWNFHVDKSEKQRWVCSSYRTSVGEH